MLAIHRAVALAAATLFALGASAAEGTADFSPTFNFSGFGTIGATKTNTDAAEYGIYTMPRGATTDVDMGVDSKLGLQGTVTLNSIFSGTVQALTRRRAQDDWRPEIEWAFAKAKMDNFTLRVGRIGGPFFMVSDFRNVGYSNTWVRPPIDVYNQVPFSRFDGADLLYNDSFGEATVNAQVFFGKTKAAYAGDYHADGKKLVGVNGTVEYGPFTFRAGYAQTDITAVGDPTVPYDTLLAGLRQAAQMPGLASLGTLADDLEFDGKKGTFTGLGMAMDWQNILVNAEYTQRRTKGYLADTNAWYLTGGYRLGAWTPYATLSRLDQKSAKSDTVIPAVAQLAPLKAGVNYLLKDVSQRTKAIGVRWDVMPNVDLKAQVDWIKVPDDSVGLFLNASEPGMPAAISGKTVRAYSLAVDFVF